MLHTQPTFGTNSRIETNPFSRQSETSTLQGSILLIDDDQDIVEAVGSILRAAGHEVRSTTHGSDIFRLLDLLNPRLVITDVIMPDIDTIDAIAVLHAHYPCIKIIAISGNPHLLTLATQQGADHTLAKPFSAHRLNVLIAAALQ
jgi:DNA-binding NtrC family response regulator